MAAVLRRSEHSASRMTARSTCGRAARSTRLAGACNYCINAGGDIRVRGEPIAGERWRIGIQHPTMPADIAAVVVANDLAIAMGGDGPQWTAGLDGYGALTILVDETVLSTPAFEAVRG